MESAREPADGPVQEQEEEGPPSPDLPSPAAPVLAFHRVTVVGL